MKATRNCCWLLLAGLVSCLLLPKAATDSVQTFAPAETTWKKFEEKLLTLPMEKHRFQRRLMETARIDRRRDIARKGRVPSDQKHEIVIALKQRNIDLLEKKLREVSDPNSLLYGQHLTTQEVNQLTGNPEAVAFVKSFLQRQGISVIKVSRNNAFITAEASVGQWEELLETQFHYFEQEDQEGQLFVRTLSYSLPENLAEHVHTLFRVAHMPNKVRGIPHYSVINNQSNSTDFRSYGRNHSPTLRRSSGSVNTLTSSLNTVTPSLVKSYHEIDSTVGNSLASQAVYETIGQTYSPADLAAFQRHFKLSVEPVAHVINGHSSDNVCASNGGSDCIEANLDVQYLMSTAQSVPTTYYYWGEDDFMLAWLLDVAEMLEPPLVFSISYGASESEFLPSYIESFNVEAMKLGVRGVTIMVSSGDDGAPGSDARLNALGCGYAPDFPSVSPYITSVGGTMGPEKNQKEVTCQSDLGGIITSGGGFSEFVSRPDWQDDAVDSYFQKVLNTDKAPPKGYNPYGRGYPDVSALASNYEVAVGGKLVGVSGTSASAPVVAGMISLINSARLAVGKSSVGWINPVLYSNYNSFTRDVKDGGNFCVASNSVCCRQGFHAATGWDPVTGLGSIHYPSLKSVFMSLGDNIDVPTESPTVLPGQPTTQPVSSPTKSPTVTPTVSPTSAAGWIVVSDYSSTECKGTVTDLIGIPSGLCQLEYDSTTRTEIIGSRLYYCTDYSVELLYFSSTNCRGEENIVARQRFYLGCTPEAQSYYYDDSKRDSTDLQCYTGASSEVPIIAKKGDTYAVKKSYDNVSGCYGPVAGFEAYKNTYCFNVHNQEGKMSFSFSFPSLIFFSGYDCNIHGHHQQQALDTECDAVGNDNGYYSAKSEKAFVVVDEFAAHGDRKIVHHMDNSEEFGYEYMDLGQVELYEVWEAITAVSSYQSIADTIVPTHIPTPTPSRAATDLPTLLPTISPTVLPSLQPTISPTSTVAPSILPTIFPTLGAGETYSPSLTPTNAPTQPPAVVSLSPSLTPTISPSTILSAGPTIVPSVVPTKGVTYSPTLKESSHERILFSASQELKGISSTTYLENLPENNAAFTAAVAFAIDGMSSSHVQITGVISGSIAKKTQENELYIDHCLVSYTITFHLRETKYSTATEAFASMSSNLVRTVASGEFNTLLHAYSVPTKASNLIATTSTTVTISSTYTVDETATVDDDETDVNANNNEGDPPPAGLSDAGIALVVLMCVIIVGTTAWLIISRTNWLKSGDFNTSLFSVVNRKEKKKRRYNVILGDSSHGNVINAIHESHDEDDGDMEFTEIDDKVGSHRPHANADNYRDNAGDDEEVEISLSNDSPFRSRGGYNSLTKDLDEERV